MLESILYSLLYHEIQIIIPYTIRQTIATDHRNHSGRASLYICRMYVFNIDIIYNKYNYEIFLLHYTIKTCTISLIIVVRNYNQVVVPILIENISFKKIRNNASIYLCLKI